MYGDEANPGLAGQPGRGGKIRRIGEVLTELLAGYRLEFVGSGTPAVREAPTPAPPLKAGRKY